MLGRLNIQLETDTPPGSQSTNSAPKTPHSLRQLKNQASTIKKLLRQRTRNPPSPTKSALNQLVKGCEMAINSAIILTKENRDLRAAHEKQAQKKKPSKRQITHTGGLSIQEGIELMQQRNGVQEAQDTIQTETTPSTSQPHVRAPPRCSDCNVLGY